MTAWTRRVARSARHLRVRVTAAAALAAVVLAIAGAVVFVVLFQRALIANTDAALGTVITQLAPEVSAQVQPRLSPATPSARTTVVQLIDPTGRVSQTVMSSRGLDPTVVDGATTLATAGQLTLARQRSQVFTLGNARVVVTPVVRTDGVWLLLAAADLEQVADAAHDAEWAFAIAVPVVVLAIGAGAWLLSGAVLRPVDRMRVDAGILRQRVATGAGGSEDAPVQVRVPDSGDDIEQLARTLNQLLADLTQAADRQRDLIADAGHELRTPLTVLRTELELADRPNRSRAALIDSIQHATVEVDRLTDLANDLLLLADAERGAVRAGPSYDVATIVAEAARAHRALTLERGVEVSVQVHGDPRVRVDRDGLRRVVDNLLGNAIRVDARHVVVTVSGTPGAVIIVVEDDGPGFDSAFLPHAFDRFTRADTSRRRTAGTGTGLGLAIVAAVAHAHGGTATAANTDRGARITVTIPR